MFYNVKKSGPQECRLEEEVMVLVDIPVVCKAGEKGKVIVIKPDSIAVQWLLNNEISEFEEDEIGKYLAFANPAFIEPAYVDPAEIPNDSCQQCGRLKFECICE